MDEFGVFILGCLIALFIVFYALAKYSPGSGAEQVDWRPTRSPELEAELELDDVDQMIEAQNVRRRASGRREISEEDVQAKLQEDERWRRDLLDRIEREGSEKRDARGKRRPRPRG